MYILQILVIDHLLTIESITMEIYILMADLLLTTKEK